LIKEQEKLRDRSTLTYISENPYTVGKNHGNELRDAGEKQIGMKGFIIPLDGDTKLFDRVARKWNVDYSFHKTGPNKYLLLFKSGQADAITAAFSEYTKLVMARAKDRRPPMREQLQRFAELVKARPQERERTREAARDER